MRVDSVLLGDVRTIGKVLAAVEGVSESDHIKQVSNLLVIDVGATSGSQALDKAVEFLIARKWAIATENRPAIVLLNSTVHKNTSVAVRPFHPAYFEDFPDVLQRLRGSSVDENSLVYLDVSAIDG
ncbi:hypothetical protein ACNF49_30480 [Actinomadura sp. ATCC 39365]